MASRVHRRAGLAPAEPTKTANQASDTNYTAASEVLASVTITKANQTITGFTPASPITFTASAPGNTITLTATTSSGLPVSFAATSPSVCTTSGTNGATLTIVAAGTCTLTANQAGNDNVNAAPHVTASITINKATQTITGFNPASPINYAPVGSAGNTFTLTASGGLSGNALTYASTTPAVCTVSAAVVTIQSAGNCNLTADQTGNDNYQAAAQASASVIINKAAQSISNFNPPQNLSQAVGSTLTLSATGGASNNPVTFSTTTASVCITSGTNGVTLTIQSAGTCSVTANQAGNDNYSPATPITTIITINVPAQLYFVHPDHLGTPRAITKASDNTKVWEWKNDDPFGNNAPDENPNGANGALLFKFNHRLPGQYFDHETGTHHNYFRDYDPQTGRYVQSDPIGLDGGINTYSYVMSNPLAAADQFGLIGEFASPPPSFFSLTTVLAARRDTSLAEAVRRGALTREITLPAVGVALLPNVAALGGSAVGPTCGGVGTAMSATARLCSAPAFALVGAVAVCSNMAGTTTSSIRTFTRHRESVEQVTQASTRTLRRNTGSGSR